MLLSIVKHNRAQPKSWWHLLRFWWICKGIKVCIGTKDTYIGKKSLYFKRDLILLFCQFYHLSFIFINFIIQVFYFFTFYSLRIFFSISSSNITSCFLNSNIVGSLSKTTLHAKTNTLDGAWIFHKKLKKPQ